MTLLCENGSQQLLQLYHYASDTIVHLYTCVTQHPFHPNDMINKQNITMQE